MNNYVRLDELQKLDCLFDAFKILTGASGTQDLYIKFDPDMKLPVVSDNKEKPVGYFQYNKDAENVVFVPTFR